MRRLFLCSTCLLFLFSFVCATQTDGYSVEVPVDLVSGIVGDTVTLPCRLSPLGDAVKMEVRWFRDGIEAPLYFYTLQNPVSSIQHDEYKDRARIFIEELSVGNLSLQMSKIQTSDSGRYICSVFHKIKYAHAVVELKVTGDGKSPIWLTVLLLFVIPIFIAIVAYCRSTKYQKAVKKTTKPRGHTRNNDSLLFSDDEETDLRYQPAGMSRSSKQSTGVKTSHRTAAVTGKKNTRDQTRNNDGLFSDDEDGTSPKPKGSGDIPKELVKAGFLQRILSWMGANSSKAPVSADVTLDPKTASPSLFLSEDHKEVRLRTEQWQIDRTQKQKKWYSVLGTEGFTSGRHYWEVEVGDKQNWRLGVGEKSSGGTEPLNWTLGLRNGKFENDLGNHSSQSELRIVRVTLDMEGLQLSFFNAETRSEIQTVSVAKATGKLYPYFSPGGWDRDPLLIFDLNPEKLIKNNRTSQSEIS
ncbi:butyrophilin subfamily 1 member A1-like isoform X2 [Acipenser ruthenus]|uniref:butyrophilin subfamily 1 member A1-like isoform X2 n=1 Tax=Acipenser ruthenus TaxID=7906 RepID=UPI0027425825|nr:butyrophilin subfamily 1 member A1-like isoform X2 [Acipenser ruthenus]